MGILSVLRCLKFERKFLVPLVVIGLFLKHALANSPIDSAHGTQQNVEGLSFCDDTLVKDRDVSQRQVVSRPRSVVIARSDNFFLRIKEFHNIWMSCFSRHLYVTTLDGQISTLDFTGGGRKVWSIGTEPGDLLSSTISRPTLTNNGKQVRMIPSLSGRIYKFDGEYIEGIPVTAEDLLKSSFKFSDDTVISGGKEVRSYGVNSRTGKVIYECSIHGCTNVKNNFTDVLEEESESIPSNDVLDDILVVKRHTQTVRAIEPRTGDERWNFSIGHHELEIISNSNCQGTKDESDNIKMDFRVIVPEGIIYGMDPQDSNKVLWKHQFDSPIVSVHRMDENNQLYNVDLFKDVHWLWKGQNLYQSTVDSGMSPSVYLGVYQHQLYIQESDFIKSTIEHHAHQLQQNLISDKTDLPRIPFKQYPASSTALESLAGSAESSGSGEEEDDSPTSKEIMNIGVNEDAQSLLYEGKGFYLFTEKLLNKSSTCKRIKGTTLDDDVGNTTTFPSNNFVIVPATSSLWDYWKEIVVIALTTAFVINVLMNNRKPPQNGFPYIPVSYAQVAEEFSTEELLRSEMEAKIRSLSESNSESHYVSRFLTDFDLVQCLGKGGFGVVFEVKNKLDDCNYAVKRILLPSKKESRDRVMREVKTLANCEHKNIVRYQNAWVEQPPKDWQELKDKEMMTRDIISTSITIDSPSPTDESKAFVVDPTESTDSELTASIPGLQNLKKNDQFRKFRGMTSMSDDSSSFIQFEAEPQDNEESGGVHFKDDDSSSSSSIVFKDETSVSGRSKNKSHAISIKETSESSVSNTKQSRTHLSLELSSVSGVWVNKPSLPASGPKMYLYIQMQLCMKNSLKEWLRENDLLKRNETSDWKEIWLQIIEGVHYCHLKGLIHRDLKPGNIFFALDGQIKIGDFGLVTGMAEVPVDPATGSSSNSNSSGKLADLDFAGVSHKKHTQRVGTSLYMSPEQSKGDTYNYKVDSKFLH